MRLAHGLLVAGLAGLLPAAFSSSAGSAEGAGEVLYRDVELHGQEQSEWCWAASVQMISGLPQCGQADRHSPADLDCCHPERMDPRSFHKHCVSGRWPSLSDLPDGFTSTRHEYEGKGSEEYCALDWPSLKEALQLAPVAFAWRRAQCGGHMMVATGYLDGPDDGDEWGLVNDPYPPNAGDVKLITYEEYKWGRYKHWRDYYKKESVPRERLDPTRFTFDAWKRPAGDSPAGSTRRDVSRGSETSDGLCRIGQDVSRAETEARRAIGVLETLNKSSPQMASDLILPFEGDGPMTLGKPLAVAVLSAAKVAEGGDAVMDLLKRREEYIFPINVDSNDGPVPISSVTVTLIGEEDEKDWFVTTLGRQHLVTNLFGNWVFTRVGVPRDEQEVLQDLEESKGRAHFLIDVPGLHELFLATCGENEI